MDSRFVHFAPAATPTTAVTLDTVRRRLVATRSIATSQIGRKVHGSLARAGKVRGQTPKVAKQDKKKQPRGRAHKRIQYNRRFVTAALQITIIYRFYCFKLTIDGSRFYCVGAKTITSALLFISGLFGSMSDDRSGGAWSTLEGGENF
ncbi:hypothetical protein R6Q57_007850 [Mikania cordata]